MEPPGEVLKNFDAQVTHAALLNQNLWDDTQSKTFLNAPGRFQHAVILKELSVKFGPVLTSKLPRIGLFPIISDEFGKIVFRW